MFYKLFTVLFTAVVVSAAGSYKFERIDRDNVALLIVDHQVGLLNVVRDYSSGDFYRNVLLHASLGKLFNLPVVLTTSAETGPNGPLPKDILDMYPNATIIKRPGEINAWDNADFRAAVAATGKKQVILGGITTDVCTMFVALSMREAGYTVFANADASGALDIRAADNANARMRDAGVIVLPRLSVLSDLVRDWRNAPGPGSILRWFPEFRGIIGLHAGAIREGQLLPNETEIA
ncbi:isochorismatase family hydrolase [Thelephora ganbajun]|uniref:Isochorismatase family hydrolase n=1 Tax=Thelephora ganbajun TaxID=370292 RepID=A0ACB6ZWJ5_THEGA|nr:isochorismatase family hydrolase [Thelephora ganbajun]